MDRNVVLTINTGKLLAKRKKQRLQTGVYTHKPVSEPSKRAWRKAGRHTGEKGTARARIQKDMKRPGVGRHRALKYSGRTKTITRKMYKQ